MSTPVSATLILFVAVCAVLSLCWLPAALGSVAVLSRSFQDGVQPYSGAGQKAAPHSLVMDARTNFNTVFTGSANRSAAWHALVAQVAINASGIRLWTAQPLPVAVHHFIKHNRTAAAAPPPPAQHSSNNRTSSNHNSTAPHASGNNTKVETTLNTANTVEPELATDPMPQEQVRIVRHRVVVQGMRREHVLEMSTSTGVCAVTASLTITPDSTVFSVLFDNFRAMTGTHNGHPVLRDTASCAFRVPITLPAGLSMATLTSHLRGYASSSPFGQAAIAWTAGVGINTNNDTWPARAYDAKSYSARIWYGGESSGDDFNPIIINTELDTRNPTFSPCSSTSTSTSSIPSSSTSTGTVEVPIDFHFTLDAMRQHSELRGAVYPQSFIQIDSQDASKKFGLNQPIDFETC